MKPSQPLARTMVAMVAAAALTLILPAPAGAHARVSPAVSVAGKLQLYSLAVPTEKSGVSTSRVVMTVPSGFGIDSFAPPPPGWKMQVAQTGSGNGAAITRVTWSGGHTPTGEDSLFQFLAQPASARTYTFQVQQTYSDGAIVNWSGPESSAAPAPSIDVASSLGAGGTSVLTIIAVVLAAVALFAAGFALVSGRPGSRSLA